MFKYCSIENLTSFPVLKINQACGIRDYAPSGGLVPAPGQATGTPFLPTPVHNAVFVGFVSTQPNAADCQRSCAGDSKCNSWTFATTTKSCIHNYGQPRRQLTVDPNPTGIISGPKCCPTDTECGNKQVYNLMIDGDVETA